ncbi:MAG: pyridoxal-5-phosphate-dependent protein subunit beta, partial [Clostridia bacterium]|nr:pyridoxal-5-phosphate-dependent protein subunit beta [Clostridia bacterium]
RLFNDPAGHRYLIEEVGVDAGFVKKLPLLGISGIANLLCCIKFAKYYELTEHDVVATVGTDSADMYQSRIRELEEADGAYTPVKAAADYAGHLAGIRTDVMEELSYEAR